MKIAVLKEQAADEQRVSATPETVKKFIGLGATLAVEQGAGESASIADADYAAAGATVGSRADVLKDADIILGVQGPSVDSLSGLDRKSTRSELQSLMRISYAVFCLKKKT